MRIQKGDRGSGPPPPWKITRSQVIWVSIGNINKQWKKLDPPPPTPGKCWTLKNDRFLWNWLFDFSKITWGLKNKTKKTFFCQTDLDPPWRNVLDPRMNLLNKLGKRDKMWGSPSILSLFGNEFNISNNTGPKYSIYHMTLKLLCNH